MSVFESLPEWLKIFLLNKATKRERVGVGEVEREREREKYKEDFWLKKERQLDETGIRGGVILHRQIEGMT